MTIVRDRKILNVKCDFCGQVCKTETAIRFHNQAVTKEKKTHYEYEMETNEAKRNIILLKPEFVPQIEKEFKRVISL